MTPSEVVSFLKTSMFIQDPTDTIRNDPEFVTLSEDFLLNLIEICAFRVNPLKTLSTLDKTDLYPIILLAKKEVYHHLATKNAPMYDLAIAGSTGSSTLSRSQRFNHYYKMIQQVSEEYNQYLATGVPIQVVETILASKYFSPRNYELAKKPVINLEADNVLIDGVELSWQIARIDKFHSYELYIGTAPIVDKYENNAVSESATLVKRIDNIHTTSLRVNFLTPSTEYHFAIILKERNGLTGYSEIQVTTLGEN